jgi:hypothetical protein
MSDIEQMLYKYMDKHGNTISQWKNNDYDYAQTLPENEQMEIVPELVALIQEQVRLARISELKQLEPPEQYEEYARIAGTDACYICGFNAVLFRKVIAERIKALKGEK